MKNAQNKYWLILGIIILIIASVAVLFIRNTASLTPEKISDFNEINSSLVDDGLAVIWVHHENSTTKNIISTLSKEFVLRYDFGDSFTGHANLDDIKRLQNNPSVTRIEPVLAGVVV